MEAVSFVNPKLVPQMAGAEEVMAAPRDLHHFYTDYLGLSVEGFNLGWVANYRSPSGEATVQLVTRDATAPHDSVISVARRLRR